MNELLQAIADHLTFFGYQITPVDAVENIPPGTFNAQHATRAHFWVIPIGQGALFRALFRPSPAALADPAGFLSFLNDANSACLVGRYWYIYESLAIGGWYCGSHERDRFDIFFGQFMTDVGIAAALWPDRVARYLSSGPAIGRLQKG